MSDYRTDTERCLTPPTVDDILKHAREIAALRIAGGEAERDLRLARAEIERLNKLIATAAETGDYYEAKLSEAEEQLAAAQAETVRLTTALSKANDQAEHFERQWYLRGDELEAAQARVAELELVRKRLIEDAKTLNEIITGVERQLDGPNGAKARTRKAEDKNFILSDRITELERQVAELEPDAKRYRWLCEQKDIRE